MACCCPLLLLAPPYICDMNCLVKSAALSAAPALSASSLLFQSFPEEVPLTAAGRGAGEPANLPAAVAAEGEAILPAGEAVLPVPAEACSC